MICTLHKCYRLFPTLWADTKANCVPASLRSPKGKCHCVPPAFPWVRSSVILYQGCIQWQLPNVIGRMHLLHAKRTKGPSMLYWYGWWRHETQLVLHLMWVCLERVILHDKYIPSILSSLAWKENLSILGHDYDVWSLSHSSLCNYSLCPSFFICMSP